MASPRYFPYDPIGFPHARAAAAAAAATGKVTGGDVTSGDRGHMTSGHVPRGHESMIANSLLSLQHIKNYASQQMPAFQPPPAAAPSRLA